MHTIYMGMAMYRVHRVPILHNIIHLYAYYMGMAMYRVHRVPYLQNIIHFYVYFMGMTMYRVRRCMLINNPYQIVVNKLFNIVLQRSEQSSQYE